ncbi:MATE family efflux transporter [Defluviitalea raffinosedens]|nr:MATE family efflux transporter [Defluviitalea raffinosedens]
MLLERSIDMTKHLDFKKSNRTLLLTNTQRDVLRIAWPVLVELFLGSLFGMIDMIMLGRIVDPAVAAASISAVGMTNQPLFIGLSLVQALNIGGTAIIARYVGAKQTDKVENVLQHIILLTLILLAIPLSLFGVFFADSILGFMGAQTDTLTVGRGYFKIISIGFLFQSFNFAISAALRGAGNTKTTMRINLSVNLINVIGNAILIYGLLGVPALGVTGAGISTTFSQFLASIILIIYLIRGKSIIRLTFKERFKFDKDILYNLIKIGVPASLEQMALRIGLLLFAKIVAGLGTVIFAAHQICLSILGLSFNPGQAFGIATSSLVGQGLGAKDPERAEAYAKESRRIGSLISSLMAFLFFVFSPQLISLYTNDPEIIQKASVALKIIALVQPFQSSQLILAGGLRGAGDTFWPLISTFIGVLGIRVILAYIFVNLLNLGLPGAWMGVFVDQFVRWGIIYIRFKSGKWKTVTIR